VGWPEDDDRNRLAKAIQEAGPVDEATAKLFVNTYGTRGLDVARRMASDQSAAQPLVLGRSERMAQVDYAVEKELAKCVSDVMIRRTQLYYRDPNQGLSATPAVAERMGRLLGWSSERREAEISAYTEEVNKSRAWKVSP
jgi:glycerol-3-phosphate dehydrogenase